MSFPLPTRPPRRSSRTIDVPDSPASPDASASSQPAHAMYFRGIHLRRAGMSRFFIRKRTRKLIFTWLSILAIIGFLVQPFSTGRFSLSTLINPLAALADGNADPPPSDVLTAPEQVNPHLPSLVVGMDITPKQVSVGGVFTATVTTTNQAPDAATNLTITLPLPVGAVSYPDPNSNPNGWTWTQTSLGANTSATFTATLQLSQSPTGAAVLAFPQATAAGLDMPIKAVGGTLVIPSGPTTTSAAYSTGTTASLTSSDGTVHLAVPTDAYSTSLTLTYTTAPLPGNLVPPDIAGYKRGFGTFYLNAADTSNTPVHQFSNPLTLSYTYTPEQLRALGISEADLTIFWFDESQPDGGAWVPATTDVDEASHTATAQVSHFSPFQLSDGSSPSSAYIPSLQGWQVGLYDGSVSYQYPIDVPAGPGGIKPNVNLSYSSTATDGKGGERAKSQSSWVGKGWSLDTGFIALQKVGDNHGSSARYYSMSFNGMSFDITRVGAAPNVGTPNPTIPTDWEWRATDENFVRVRVEENPQGSYGNAQSPGRGGYKSGTPLPRYIWHVWTKDGTRFDFEEDAWQAWRTIAGDGTCLDEQTYFETYKWYLSKIVDTHGNQITYNYSRQDGNTHYNGWGVADGVCSGLGVQGTVDWSVYPTSATWGSNANVTGSIDRYMVQFQSTARTMDTSEDRAINQLRSAPQETRRLDAIQVYSKQSVTWELVRQYNLTYASGSEPPNQQTIYLLSDRTNRSGSTYTPEYAYTKLTLLNIKQVGYDGSTSLPPTTFTYGLSRGAGQYPNGSWNRLLTADNGQGGASTFTYEDIATVLPAEIRGRSDFENNRRVIQKVITDGLSGSGHSYTWTYTYGNGDISGIHYGYAENNTVGSLLGGHGAPNTYPNSATVYFNRFYQADPQHWANYLLLIHQPNSEFRGHKYVAETDPNGNVVEHWFYQGDARLEEGDTGCTPNTTGVHILGDGASQQPDPCVIAIRDREALKGKEYKTVVHNGGTTGPVLSGTRHNYSVNLLASGTNRGYGYNITDQLTGLWRFFTYESQTDDAAIEGNTTPITHTVTYAYDATYGNLTDQQEGQTTGSTFTVLRETTHSYALAQTGDTPYIVDRKRSDNVKDGAGNWLARTIYGWDGSYGGPPTLTKGELTLVRKYYDIPLNWDMTGITHSSDTSYSYDGWSNQTTVTTYQGPGQVNDIANNSTWSPPGNNSPARTITTTYDSIFHALPIQYDPPSVNGVTLRQSATYSYTMGLIMSVTGPNGSGTTQYVNYDMFGRMTKLWKPGDSEAVPTIQMVYLNYYAPFHRPFEYIEVLQESAGMHGVNRDIMKIYDGMGREIQTKSESMDPDSQSNHGQSIVADKQYDGVGNVTSQSQPRYVDQDLGDHGFWYYIPVPGSGVNWTQTTYDGLGRPLVTTQPDATQTTTTYSLQSGLRSVATIDANHHKTEQRSDVFGRLQNVVEYTGNSSPYTTYSTTSYQYNPLDLLTQVTDGAGHSTGILYDSLGRKTNMADPTMGLWSYGYDPNGNIITQTNALAQTITFSYDALDRLTAKGYPNTGDNVTYRYDESMSAFGKGQRTSMNVQGAVPVTTTWQYDERERVVNQVYSTAAISNPSPTLGWLYDSADRVTSMTYPSGEVLNYEYDAAWRQTKAHSVGYNLDYASVDPVAHPYTPLDQPTNVALGNGLQQQYTYDTINHTQRLTQLQVGTGGNSWGVVNLGYTYDNVGNVKTLYSNITSQTQTFGYDERDRLTSWGMTAGGGYGSTNEAYDYDVMGNIQHKGPVGAQTQYFYGAVNGGPMAVNSTKIGANTTSYSYDQDGNMLSQNGGGLPTRAFSWNANNMPTQITSGSAAETYSYDADSTRFTRTNTTNGVTTYYLGGLFEQDMPTGTTRSMYQFNGQVIAQREILASTPTPTSTNTATATATATATRTATNTPTRTSTSTNTPTRTNTATNTSTRTSTSTSTPTATSTPTSGLKGEYYNDPVGNGQFNTLAMVRYDGPVDFVWGSGSPGKSVNADNFSVRWTGRVETLNSDNSTGTYTFQTVSDEGVRLWVNDQLIIDHWTAHSETTDTGQIYLQGGGQTYSIRLEYFEGSGNATMQLKWLPPGGGLTSVTIPGGQLLPPLSSPPAPPPATGGPGTLIYLHTDQLGSVGAVTTDNGAVVSRQRFDPWGKVLTGGNVTQTNINYTGQKLDTTGLLNYNARMYDPVLARFVSPDSIVPGVPNTHLVTDFHEMSSLASLTLENISTLAEGFWYKDRNPNGSSNPQTLNRYSYVQDNPLRYVDPTGHFRVSHANNDAANFLLYIEAARQAIADVKAGNQATSADYDMLKNLAGGVIGAASSLAGPEAQVAAWLAAAIVSAVNLGADTSVLDDMDGFLAWMEMWVQRVANATDDGAYVDFFLVAYGYVDYSGSPCGGGDGRGDKFPCIPGLGQPYAQADFHGENPPNGEDPRLPGYSLPYAYRFKTNTVPKAVAGSGQWYIQWLNRPPRRCYQCT